SQFKYSYFNESAIVENFTGTYADKTAPIERKEISWNHSLGEVLDSLVKQGIEITAFQEFPFSPWNCFKGMKEITPGRFTIEKLNINIPLVYALKGQMK
ncbi:MAG: SAM-dependent methyltransferase, partial [Ferruginibacter sp.]